MSRSAPLFDAAFESWLAFSPPSSTEKPESSADPISEERLIDRALAGHSPSARALANASDSVTALAEAADPAAPPDTLRDRILKAVTIAPPTFRSPSQTKRVPRHADAPIPLLKGDSLSPNEALGLMHKRMPDEQRRIDLIERHGIRGGSGQEAIDRALTLLIEQYSPFLGFEIVFVSTVVGDVTIHRVHRGFPPAFGDIDIVPREISFCTHTISSGEPFVVEDAAKEAFFRQSDLVQKFGCRAYLGVPLFKDDVAVGALCGISRSPQVIFPEDVSLAQRFARIAQALVANDEAEIARLVADPAGYPAAGPPARPIVLSHEAFGSIVEAQQQRVGAATSTWLVPVSTGEWQSISASLPPTLLAGVLEGKGDARGVLLPEEHPQFDELKELAERGRRLG